MKARSWWLVFMALVVYGAVLYAVHPDPKATVDVTPGSSASAEPMGDLALVRLWSHLNLPFQTFAQVPALLPADTHSVFVSVEPQPSVYNSKDAQALLSFVKAGHEVIWVTSVNDPLTKALHLNVVKVPSKTVTSLQWGENTPAPLTGLNFQALSRLAGEGLNQAATKLTTRDGASVGAIFSMGKGHLVVWTVPSVWENQAIGKANNLQIPWRLLSGRAILWDEYGHGVVAQGLLGTLFGGTRAGTLLLLLAAGLTYLFATNTRFGSLKRAPDEQPRVDVELVHALAWHFKRRPLGAKRERLLDAAVRRRLSRLFGVSDTASWEVLDAVVLPTLTPKLQQGYAKWRSGDIEEGLGPSRATRKQRLGALRSLMSELNEMADSGDRE